MKVKGVKRDKNVRCACTTFSIVLRKKSTMFVLDNQKRKITFYKLGIRRKIKGLPLSGINYVTEENIIYFQQ